MYEVIAQGTGGVRYGHKERAGIYLTDSAEDATAFQTQGRGAGVCGGVDRPIP